MKKNLTNLYGTLTRPFTAKECFVFKNDELFERYVEIPEKSLKYDEMNDALIYSEGFFEILEANDAVENSGNYKTNSVQGKFELKNVDFIYPNGTAALHNINMVVAPNKITALVGLSGAGKVQL